MSNFKVSNSGGDDWLICWTGQDEKGVHWNVTTNQVHASELFQFSKGAEEDARLIADLLNKHYSSEKPTEALDNLLHAVINESFTPEMEELGRRAKVEVMQLIDIKNSARARLVELGMIMPCGHFARYAVNGEDGTQYCCMCVLEADKQTIANLVMVDVEETNEKCPFCKTRAILKRVGELLHLTAEIGSPLYDDVIANLINDTASANSTFQCYCEEQ